MSVESTTDISALLKPVFIARILSYVPPHIKTDIRGRRSAAPVARLTELAAVTNSWSETLRHFSAIIWHSWLADEDGATNPQLYFLQSVSLQPKKIHFIAVFFRACERSVTWLIRMLFVACLERYGNPSLLLDAVDPIRSTTALHLACLRDQPDVVSLLLEYTSNVVKVLNSTDATGNIPLSIAVTNGSVNVIKYFAGHHDPQVTSAVDFANVSFLGTNNILHLACKSHKVDVLRSILEFTSLDSEKLLMQGGTTTPIFVAAENVDHADEMLSVIFSEIADQVLEQQRDKNEKPVWAREIPFDERMRLLAALGRPHRCAGKNILRRLCEASKLEQCSKSIRFFASLFPHLIFATSQQEAVVASQLSPTAPFVGQWLDLTVPANTSAFSTLSARTCFTVEQAKQKIELVKFFLDCAAVKNFSHRVNPTSSFALIVENKLIQEIRIMWENEATKWWTNLLDPKVITGVVKSALMPVHAPVSAAIPQLQQQSSSSFSSSCPPQTPTTAADYEFEILKLLFRYFSKSCCSNQEDENSADDSSPPSLSSFAARNDRFIKFDQLVSRSCYSEHHLLDYVTSSALQNDTHRLNCYTEEKKRKLGPTIISSNNNFGHRAAHITGKYDLTCNPIIADICRNVALNSNVHQASFALKIIKFLTKEALASDEFLGISHVSDEIAQQKRFAKYLVTVPNAENMLPLFILADCVDRTTTNDDARQEKKEGEKTEELTFNSVVSSLAKCLIDAGSPFDVPTPFPAPRPEHNVRSAGWGESPEVFRQRLEEAAKLLPKRINDPYAGMFPIHRAARNGNASLVKLFCQEYQEKAKEDVSCDDSWSFETPVWNLKTENLLAKTPLHFAVENFHEDVVDVLLSFGADSTIADESGLLPDFEFMRTTKMELEKERQMIMAVKESEARKKAVEVASFEARKTRGFKAKYGSGESKLRIWEFSATDDTTTTTSTSTSTTNDRAFKHDPVDIAPSQEKREGEQEPVCGIISSRKETGGGHRNKSTVHKWVTNLRKDAKTNNDSKNDSNSSSLWTFPAASSKNSQSTTTTTTATAEVVSASNTTTATGNSLWNYPRTEGTTTTTTTSNFSTNANSNTTAATLASNPWTLPATAAPSTSTTTTTTGQTGWSAGGWSSSAFTPNFRDAAPLAPQFRNYFWGGFDQQANTTNHNVSNEPTWRAGAGANTLDTNHNNDDHDDAPAE